MAYVPTTFVDRSVEFPNRRKLTAVPGLADTFDVARAEGTVFAEGTKPDATNLNAEFGKIKAETDSINDSLGGLSFYEDETGKYVVGADSVPKKLGSGSTIINLIIQQVDSGFVPITTAPNLCTSGIIINKDEGAFTLQNTNEFVCNTDGELVVFGWVSNANNFECTFSVVKNGNEISVPITYSKGNTTIEVSKGDVLKFKFGVPAGNWIAGTFAIAL